MWVETETVNLWISTLLKEVEGIGNLCSPFRVRSIWVEAFSHPVDKVRWTAHYAVLWSLRRGRNDRVVGTEIESGAAWYISSTQRLATRHAAEAFPIASIYRKQFDRPHRGIGQDQTQRREVCERGRNRPHFQIVSESVSVRSRRLRGPWKGEEDVVGGSDALDVGTVAWKVRST